MTEKLTITEALSEINLIKKKLDSKRNRIRQGLMRASHMPDPFFSDGGSESMINKEVQGISDLELRLFRIKAAISRANLDNRITIQGMERSIHDWILWKREVSKDAIGFVAEVHKMVKVHMDGQAKQPQVYKDEKEQMKLVSWVYSIDYAQWLKLEETLRDVLEKLDGQLSLKNATIVVEF